jgi:hypothetical protein
LCDAEGVPFTFLAHQAPVLPLMGRGGLDAPPPRRRIDWDGVALVAGSMAPDLAYVTRGWWYGPWGIPMWFDGHRPQNLFVVTAAATLLAVVVRWWILPVLPLALPDGGSFHLRDYQRLSLVRHRWWETVASAFVGAVTHLVLDAFTHSDGAGSGSSGFFQTPLFGVGSRTVHLYTALQYGGSVVLGAYTLWWMWRAGRARAFRRIVVPGEVDAIGTDGERGAPDPELPRGPLVAFWSVVAASCVIAAAYAQARSGYHFVFHRAVYGTKSVVIISFCWVAFIGLTLACLVIQLYVADRRPSDPAVRHRDSVAA